MNKLGYEHERHFSVRSQKLPKIILQPPLPFSSTHWGKSFIVLIRELSIIYHANFSLLRLIYLTARLAFWAYFWGPLKIQVVHSTHRRKLNVSTYNFSYLLTDLFSEIFSSRTMRKIYYFLIRVLLPPPVSSTFREGAMKPLVRACWSVNYNPLHIL